MMAAIGDEPKPTVSQNEEDVGKLCEQTKNYRREELNSCYAMQCLQLTRTGHFQYGGRKLKNLMRQLFGTIMWKNGMYPILLMKKREEIGFQGII